MDFIWFHLKIYYCWQFSPHKSSSLLTCMINRPSLFPHANPTFAFWAALHRLAISIYASMKKKQLEPEWNAIGKWPLQMHDWCAQENSNPTHGTFKWIVPEFADECTKQTAQLVFANMYTQDIQHEICIPSWCSKGLLPQVASCPHHSSLLFSICLSIFLFILFFQPFFSTHPLCSGSRSSSESCAAFSLAEQYMRGQWTGNDAMSASVTRVSTVVGSQLESHSTVTMLQPHPHQSLTASDRKRRVAFLLWSLSNQKARADSVICCRMP